MNKKVLVVNGSSYFEPFKFLGLPMISNPMILEKNPDEVALVVFTGGEDVSPKMYGHPDLGSYYNERRDELETAIFRLAKKDNIPMAGICRGSQFLCVMAGGKLVQDISNHGTSHALRYKTQDGNILESPEVVTSTHHQMQYPFDLDDSNYELLAWSSKPRSGHYAFEDKVISAEEAKDEFRIEPDCVFYNNINALAMQYHPEYMPKDSWGFKFAEHLIDIWLKPLIEKRLG